MKKYTKKYKKELSLTHSKKEDVINWIKKLEKGELKDEVANYGSFSRIILEKILGYDYEENIIENVKEDYGRGLSEFALKKDNKNFMVIELKGSDSDLDKPQNRKNDKRTPVDQAFDYAKKSGDINWIFVSNYNEFRLYNWHKKQHQYISFKAEDLKDPETFKQFMLVFSSFSTIENNLIDKLVSKTIFVERDLEDEFYKLYNETRLMLIAEIEHLNPEFTREQSVHYSQLILNRYIFICFAEDLGLLPGEISVESIENPVKNNNLGRSEIWHRLNSLFIDVNEGNDFKKIYGYNGGLFNENLEFLKIRDIVEDHSIFSDAYQKWKFEEYSLLVEEKLSPYSGKINPIYKNLMTISTFNFSSEVDVNILGHIFENSIGDIEELKADTKGRRKKDGIFYTPEHITDYICRNTIIPYLSKSGKSNTVKDLIGEYWGSDLKELDDKVGKIKIIDFACGSGAFLNKAGDILLEIHKAIHEKKYIDKMDTLAPYFDNIEMRREILLNNIYGVDLNEESVEITKLSLFLKVCKKGLKLPNLDNNIKCGNSLINDSEYTDKSFNWEIKFPEIFQAGGFDVVIGNPPYIRMEKIKEIKPYLKKNYLTFNGRADIYVYFFEKGLTLLKKGGFLGFISSNKFIKTNYGKNLRKLIINDYVFVKYVNHTYDGIFLDATTYPSVFVVKKDNPDINSKFLVDNKFQLKQSRFNSNPWAFESPEILDLRDKIDKNGIKIKNIPKLNIYYGIKTGYNEAFIINQKIKDQLIKEDPKSEEIIKPLINGKDVKRYSINFKDSFVIISKHNFHDKLKEYPAILKHLKKYESQLKNRGQVKNGQHHWLELDNTPNDDYLAEFKKDKLIYPEMAQKLFAVFDNNKFYTNKTCFIIRTEIINLKFLSVLLSSKPLNFLFKFLGSPLKGNFYNLSKTFVENLPIIPVTSEEEQPIIDLADKILELNQNLQNEVNGFKHWIKKEFDVEKLSNKLEKYYGLSEDEFINELRKNKVNIKSRKTREYLETEFAESLAIIKPLQSKIDAIDKQIDKLVYELYGLTDEEIQIIEDSINS
jgi:hypothetical protein